MRPCCPARHGTPRLPADLVRHNCTGIRQGEETYGLWRLSHGRSRRHVEQPIKTRGNLTTNDGEIAVQWALGAVRRTAAEPPAAVR